MQTTNPFDLVTKDLTLNNVLVRLQLWDMTGKERYRSGIP